MIFKATLKTKFQSVLTNEQKQTTTELQASQNKNTESVPLSTGKE